MDPRPIMEHLKFLGASTNVLSKNASLMDVRVEELEKNVARDEGTRKNFTQYQGTFGSDEVLFQVQLGSRFSRVRIRKFYGSPGLPRPVDWMG